jgi:hypothetical protein
MSDFELSVEGKSYKGELNTFGYSYRIVVTIDDIPVTFEPDEERNFRAIVQPDQIDKVDSELLKAITKEIEANLK